MSKININFYLEKLLVIDEKLGGTARLDKVMPLSDEFAII